MPNPTGPLAFYFLNHHLDHTELRLQIRALHEQGFAGLLIHARAGNQVPYLSDRWFEKVDLIFGECIRWGLEPWLYDEDPYPSGAAGGLVTANEPAHAGRVLKAERYPVGGREVDVTIPLAKLAGIFAIPSRPSDASTPYFRVDSKAGTVRSHWEELGHGPRSYYPPYLKEARAHYRAASHHPGLRILFRSEVRLKELLVVSIVPWRGGVWGEYPDLMNPEATRSFIRLTHEAYRKRIRPAYWKKIPGIFLDESKLLPLFPWNDALPERYERLFGGDLPASLPHLFRDLGPESPAIRSQYRAATGALFRENFMGPLGDWCRKNGLLFTGHISPEEDPYGQQVYTPNLTTLLKTFGLPGVDSISSLTGSAERPLLNLGAKLGESALSQSGGREYLVEALGVSGEDLDGQRMRSILDWCFSFGINRICLHGQFYSLDAERKREAPPSIFYQAPYWPHFKALSAYIARVSGILRRTRRRATLAYLYPSSFFASRTDEDLHARHTWDKAFYREGQAIGRDLLSLSSMGLDFDFIDDLEFAQAPPVGDRIQIGRARYRALLVPAVSALSIGALKRLGALMRKGFPVYFMGPTPRALDGRDALKGFRAKRWKAADAQALRMKLSEKGPDPFPARWKLPPHCTVRQSRGTSERFDFFYNQGSKPAQIGADLPENFRLEWLDANVDRFEQIPIHRGSAKLELLPGQGLLVRQSRLAGPVSKNLIPVPRAKTNLRVDLTRAAWTLERLKENVFPLKDWKVIGPKGSPGEIRLPVGAIGMEHGEPGKSAPIVFRARFKAENAIRNPRILVDRFTREHFDFRVNGKPLGGFSPCRYFDESNHWASLQKHLVSGVNTVECRAALDPKMVVHRFKELIYIVGEFDVSGGASGALVACERRKTVKALPAWGALGWPYYSGMVRYRTEFRAPGPGPCRLELANPGSFAKIWVNGKEAGHLYTKPYHLEVGEYLVAGGNVLEIEAANTLENLIEGKRVESGIQGPVALVFG
ncbi:MAG: hypothetical protein J0L75_09580 [Spirochaetes bacterium]|nr:hypothetical protein [Spirochaetota bacterium]